MELKNAKEMQKKIIFQQYVNHTPKRKEQKYFDLFILGTVLVSILSLVLVLPVVIVVGNQKALYVFWAVWGVVTGGAFLYAFIRKKVLMRKLLDVTVRREDIEKKYLNDAASLEIFSESPTALYVFSQEPDEELLSLFYIQFYHLKALWDGRLKVYFTSADLFNEKFKWAVPRDKTIMGIVYSDLLITQDNVQVMQINDISKYRKV